MITENIIGTITVDRTKLANVDFEKNNILFEECVSANKILTAPNGDTFQVINVGVRKFNFLEDTAKASTFNVVRDGVINDTIESVIVNITKYSKNLVEGYVSDYTNKNLETAN